MRRDIAIVDCSFLSMPEVIVVTCASPLAGYAIADDTQCPELDQCFGKSVR
jgi:hypothetical protein